MVEKIKSLELHPSVQPTFDAAVQALLKLERALHEQNQAHQRTIQQLSDVANSKAALEAELRQEKRKHEHLRELVLRARENNPNDVVGYVLADIIKRME